MVIRVKQQKEVTMKKRYINPTINVVKVGVQPLMALSASQDNPQTQIDHDEYEGDFSSRRRRRDEWEDEEEEDF